MTDDFLIDAEKAEIIGGKTLRRLIEYLRNVKKWTDSQIIELIEYLSK